MSIAVRAALSGAALVLSAAFLVRVACAQDATNKQPATKPATTRPTATKPAVERDWTAYECKTFGLRFRVPKNWKRLELKSSTEVTDFIFVFDTAPSSKQILKRQFKLMIGQPLRENPSLEAAVQRAKDEAKQVDGATEFIADEAAEVAGEPAWRLEWDGVIHSTRTTTTNGKSKTEQIETKVRRRETIWIEDGKVCLYGVDSDATAFATIAKLSDRVAATIERTKH